MEVIERAIESTAVAVEAGSMDARRRHPRTVTPGFVFGQVAQTDDDDLIGRAFKGEIIEISPCGLRVETSLDIAYGTLDLWVEIEGFPERMFLSTEIRWSEWLDEDRFHVGVEIVPNPLSDLDAWCAFQRAEWFRYKAEHA